MVISKQRLMVIIGALLRLHSPASATVLPFGQVQVSVISTVKQSNSYMFSASANDVVDFTMVTTNGNLSPKVRLYNPDGSLNSAASPNRCSGGTIELNEVKLAANGSYTVLLGDCSDTNIGSYSFYAQRTNNPSGATALQFGSRPGRSSLRHRATAMSSAPAPTMSSISHWSPRTGI